MMNLENKMVMEQLRIGSARKAFGAAGAKVVFRTTRTRR